MLLRRYLAFQMGASDPVTPRAVIYSHTFWDCEAGQARSLSLAFPFFSSSVTVVKDTATGTYVATGFVAPEAAERWKQVRAAAKAVPHGDKGQGEGQNADPEKRSKDAELEELTKKLTQAFGKASRYVNINGTWELVREDAPPSPAVTQAWLSLDPKAKEILGLVLGIMARSVGEETEPSSPMPGVGVAIWPPELGENVVVEVVADPPGTVLEQVKKGIQQSFTPPPPEISKLLVGKKEFVVYQVDLTATVHEQVKRIVRFLP